MFISEREVPVCRASCGIPFIQLYVVPAFAFSGAPSFAFCAKGGRGRSPIADFSLRLPAETLELSFRGARRVGSAPFLFARRGIPLRFCGCPFFRPNKVPALLPSRTSHFRSPPKPKGCHS